MRRKALDEMESWFDRPDRGCLAILGISGVGKTFAVEDFASSRYDSVLKLDFHGHKECSELFGESRSPEDILWRLQMMHPSFRFDKGRSLLFLDNIHLCSSALSVIESLASCGTVDVIACGRLSGEDVGDVRTIRMVPMDFEEYLWAKGMSEA